MKEIKAFIRSSKAESVLVALKALGLDGITLIDVMGHGTLADPRSAKYSVSTVSRYSQLAKLEVVCCDDMVHQIIEAVRAAAHTGLPGDGIIYTTTVEMAVKVRTGAVGEASIRPAPTSDTS